jgi:hypothetical protein
MALPNFLILGAVKSGTTSLYEYLRQHPQIYMSPTKESSFFASEGAEPGVRGPRRRWASQSTVADINTYRALFRGVTDQVAIGEASPVYLINPRAPARIKHYIPDAKLIAILRDPVESAYSAFVMRRLYGDERLEDFSQAVVKRDENAGKYWRLRQRYIDVGFYYTHLKRYFDIFDGSQINVHLYEDFKADPINVLQDIFRFLGVDDTFLPDVSIKYNVGGLPRTKAWHIFYSIRPVLRSFIPARLRKYAVDRLLSLQAQVLVKPPSLEPAVRAQLIEIYRDDILKLEKLIQRDLSMWMQ